MNRAAPDTELDAFVDLGARRIMRLDNAAITEANCLRGKATRPDDAVLPAALERFFASAARPETKARTGHLIENGLQARPDPELNLGHRVVAGAGKSAGR